MAGAHGLLMVPVGDGTGPRLTQMIKEGLVVAVAEFLFARTVEPCLHRPCNSQIPFPAARAQRAQVFLDIDAMRRR